MRELINNLHEDEIKKGLIFLVEQTLDALKNYESWLNSGRKGKISYRENELPEGDPLACFPIEIEFNRIHGVMFYTSYFTDDKLRDYVKEKNKIVDRINQLSSRRRTS